MREKGWRSVNIKKINVKNNYKKIGKKKKKTLKLERLQNFVFFVVCLFVFYFYFFNFFKLKGLTQNPKVELKRLWVGLDCGTK